jgi:NAD(P) transhydrogenase subunit alpha
MRIAILDESKNAEPRVAATVETIRKLTPLGATFVVEKGAGLGAAISDADYEAAGASIAKNAKDALKDADVVLAVRRPKGETAASMKSGALLLAAMDPYGNAEAIEPFAKAGVAAFSMELMPRITRAQVMDILSSQANLAGYRAVLDAAAIYGRAFPMMMTAAGTVPAARVFIMGAGVAGLQAIATARRLGAIVTATDVRPAAKEQVESLGAKFVAVEDDEFKQAETAAGYAKPMSAEYQAKQAELVAAHIAKQDIVITTALIPGRPAPKLVSTAMVESMKMGSVIVDLAVERGGNCDLAVADKVTLHKGVSIIANTNTAGQLAPTASALFAKNLYAFLETMIDKGEKTLKVNWEDELVKATLLCKDGALVHPIFAPKS